MNRYDQGFIKFEEMEQATDKERVKTEDYNLELKLREDVIIGLNDEIRLKDKQLERWQKINQDQIEEIEDKLFHTRVAFVLTIVIGALLMLAY
jgi:hypothetical protein